MLLHCSATVHEGSLRVIHHPTTVQVGWGQKAMLPLHICGGPTNTVAGRGSKAVSW